MTFILIWCLASTFVLGVFATPVGAVSASSSYGKCSCGVKGCKICYDGCKGKKCTHLLLVKYRCANGTSSSKHPDEVNVCCKKHPKLAKQGINYIEYRYAKKSWKHTWVVKFSDGTSIWYNKNTNKQVVSDDTSKSSMAGKYAKKHNINLYNQTDPSKKVVKGKTKEGNSSSSSSDDGSVFGECGSDRRYTGKSMKYFDYKVDYNDSVDKIGGQAISVVHSSSSKGKIYGVGKDNKGGWNACMKGGGLKTDGNPVTVKGDGDALTETEIKYTDTSKKKAFAKLTPGFIGTEGLGSSENTTKYIFGNTYKNITVDVDGVKASGIEIDGKQFLYCALMQGMTANSEAKYEYANGKTGNTMGSYAGSTSSVETYLVDIILKDGTQYHCITRTCAGGHHTNADGDDKSNAWVDGKTKVGYDKNGNEMPQDGITGRKSKLLQEDRKASYYAVPISTGCGYSSINLFYSGSLKSLTKDNKVSVVRIWTNSVTKKKLSDVGVTSGAEAAMTKGEAPKNSGEGSGGKSAEQNSEDGSKAQSYPDGYLSEAALSSFNKLVEAELTEQVANSDKSSLTQEETEGLSDWQMNVARSKEHKGIATWINYILTVIGVLLIIWGSVFYMAYWFDMINPFVDLDLVSRLSLGRFTASHELDGSCTWSLTKHTEGRGTRQQTINSKVALFISVCAIAIGVLIISGGLYRIVRSIYYGGAVLFHQIFG